MAPVPDRDLARVERKLREKGLRVTPQRMAVARAVLTRRDHPTADDLFRAVRRRFPSLSLTTVYHTLETLKALGEVTEIRLGEVARFDPNREAHDHFTCLACGRIEDVDRVPVPIEAPPAVAAEHEVVDVHVFFTGYCGDCRRVR
jgi:Fur family peroxide stress response transcriptional regulator